MNEIALSDAATSSQEGPGNYLPKTPKESHDNERHKICDEGEEKLNDFVDLAKQVETESIERWQQEIVISSDDDIQELRGSGIYEKQQTDRQVKRRCQVTEGINSRDDLDCDDLKPLPKYQELLLPSWIPKDLYSDLLSLHNFFCCFSSLLPENTGKPLFTLGELASAVVSSSVENTRLVDIFKVLLRARADVVKSEDGDEANLYKYEEIGYEANGDLEHHVHGKRIRDANKKHARVRRCHGVNVSDLEVNDMTISEVLRLTLETSGYYPVGGRRMERLEFRGGIRCYEDDGYLFALNNPKTMEKLKEKSLLQITPKERMNILNALVQQLLSYKKYREYMHDRMTHIEELRKHLRKLHHLAEMQEKQVQHSLQMKKAEGKPMESKSVSNIKNWLYRTKDSVKENDPPPNAIDNSPTKMLDESTKLADTEKTTVSKELQNLQGYLQQVTEQQNVGDKRKILESIPYTELKSAQISEFRELQKQIYEEELNEVQTELYSEQAAMGMCFLGRDRAFRSYFFLHTFGLLLIENPDQCTVGYCDQVSPIVISQPTNVVVKIKKLSSPCESKNVLDYENERIRRYCCTGSPDTCPVHKTKSDSHRFFYYVERDGVENLLNALNPRGCREIDLIESLTLLKDKYARKINENAEKADAIDFLSVCFEVSPEFAEEIESVDDFMESNFIKEILQQEETIFKKRFGDVSISLSCSREIWRNSLQEQKSTSTLCKDKYLPIHQNKSANDYVLYMAEELESEELTSVEKLGIALLQLVHGMRFETEILGYPFENPGRKKGEYIAWQQDLAACQSHSALHLFLATFLKSINWDYVVPVPDSKNRQPKQHLFTGMTLRSRRPITSGTYKEYLTSDEEDVDSKNNQKTQKSRSPSHLDFLTDEASDSEENGSISARRVENKKLRENNQPAKEFLASDSDSTDSWHSKRKQHKYTQMSLRNKNPIKKLSSPCESKNVLDYENERIRRYCCTGNPDTCPVHKTKSDSHRFFYYVERDGVENLLNALNPRGCREIDLIESLTLLKDKYARKINENAEKADAIDFLSVCFEVSPEFAEEIESVDNFMESNFIKEILQQEETIFKKRFGDVSISLSCSREIWRKSLQEQKSTSTLCKDKYLPIHQNKSANDYVLYTAEELKSEELTSVEKLGIALLQLVHGMRFETEILGYPFENPGRKKGEYIAWQQDLAACQSHSALHLFLATFLKAVNWDYVVRVPDSEKRQPKQHLFTGMTLRSRRPITSGTYKEYLTSDEEDVDSKNNKKTQKSRSPSHLDFLTDEASDSEENGSISARSVENKKLRENNQPAKEFLASDSDSTDSWHSKRKQHKYTQMSLRNKNPVKYK
ncbi:williams-Beuren syndrome DDT (WSD), d-TOX E motif domain-containing protein [Ditylenchus destructor]|uniref:Williams-Beuren syndrome DDT (WSD), d-TOX E motif domain-containing protein n=1 Tax=Ditylenchus destructor TaxID=166010 RepID=A0AAD4N2W6_9BILA|nr:williams-Beuren syndrome DDT (WSD), d-TOX E motif domain-containing protein [Ditylenchus destructor]